MYEVFAIESVPDDPRRLTQCVLQVTALLGLYQAELARILGLRCPEIGALAAGRLNLAPGTLAWSRAVQLVRCYRALYTWCGGDGVAMRHWIHVAHVQLHATPHLAMVDGGQLDMVVEWLEQAALPAA